MRVGKPPSWEFERSDEFNGITLRVNGSYVLDERGLVAIYDPRALTNDDLFRFAEQMNRTAKRLAEMNR